MEKVYLIILQDVWNNLTYLGVYSSLEKAIPDINDGLPDGYEIDELKEYVSTFGYCFDRDVYNSQDEDDEVYSIRGFILDKEMLGVDVI